MQWFRTLYWLYFKFVPLKYNWLYVYLLGTIFLLAKWSTSLFLNTLSKNFNIFTSKVTFTNLNLSFWPITIYWWMLFHSHTKAIELSHWWSNTLLFSVQIVLMMLIKISAWPSFCRYQNFKWLIFIMCVISSINI
jgi:hypothetical protein